MKAFTTAISAGDEFVENEINGLYGVREVISYAQTLPDDKFGIFIKYGLSHDVLAAYDRYIKETLLYTSPSHSILDKEDLDIMIPFVLNMGKAYSQLMAHTLMTEPDNLDAPEVNHASALYEILNFFYAQQSKQCPVTTLEPRCENE